MSCPQCFSGHINPGTPLGRIETIYGRRTYIAEPPDGKQPLGIIVIIPDAFGQPFVNNKILADHYASLGQYLVYLPDFMDGKPNYLTLCLRHFRWPDRKTPLFVSVGSVVTLRYRQGSLCQHDDQHGVPGRQANFLALDPVSQTILVSGPRVRLAYSA